MNQQTGNTLEEGITLLINQDGAPKTGLMSMTGAQLRMLLAEAHDAYDQLPEREQLLACIQDYHALKGGNCVEVGEWGFTPMMWHDVIEGKRITTVFRRVG